MRLKKLVYSLILIAAFGLWQFATRGRLSSCPPLGRFITVAGRLVHYHQTGAGPDIVLLHGASGNLREWEFGLRAALEGRYRVTALDRPGHGYSEIIPDNAYLDQQAQHLRAAVAQLGIQDCVLVGHSYGGSVALAWALQSPPRAMVLLAAPSLPWPGKLDLWYRLTNSSFGRMIVVPLARLITPQAMINRLIRQVFLPQSATPGYVQNMGSALTMRSLAANVDQINALREDLRGQELAYAQLTLPLTLIHGDADRIVPLTIHSAPLSTRLPQSRLIALSGVGHMPHHSHLAEVVAAIDAAGLQRS